MYVPDFLHISVHSSPPPLFTLPHHFCSLFSTTCQKALFLPGGEPTHGHVLKSQAPWLRVLISHSGFILSCDALYRRSNRCCLWCAKFDRIWHGYATWPDQWVLVSARSMQHPSLNEPISHCYHAVEETHRESISRMQDSHLNSRSHSEV